MKAHVCHVPLIPSRGSFCHCFSRLLVSVLAYKTASNTHMKGEIHGKTEGFFYGKNTRKQFSANTHEHTKTTQPIQKPNWQYNPPKQPQRHRAYQKSLRCPNTAGIKHKSEHHSHSNTAVNQPYENRPRSSQKKTSRKQTEGKKG